MDTKLGRLLTQLRAVEWPIAASLVPMGGGEGGAFQDGYGGFQLEWKRGGRYMEIEILDGSDTFPYLCEIGGVGGSDDEYEEGTLYTVEAVVRRFADFWGGGALRK